MTTKTTKTQHSFQSKHKKKQNHRHLHWSCNRFLTVSYFCHVMVTFTSALSIFFGPYKFHLKVEIILRHQRLYFRLFDRSNQDSNTIYSAVQFIQNASTYMYHINRATLTRYKIPWFKQKSVALILGLSKPSMLLKLGSSA